MTGLTYYAGVVLIVVGGLMIVAMLQYLHAFGHELTLDTPSGSFIIPFSGLLLPILGGWAGMLLAGMFIFLDAKKM